MRLRLLACVVVAGAAACGPDERGAASPAAGVRAAAPCLRFVDRTLAAGIDFVHDSGGTGERYMPEMTGAGGALFDMDGDGDLDLLCINGGPLPGDETPKENALYANDGAGKFTRVPDAGGLAAGDDYGIGCGVADVDADGDLDVVTTTFGPDRLWLNDGRGRFTQARDAGLGGAAWSASCAFGDLDGDGLPDLWITRYLAWSLDDHEPCFTRDVPIYCGPQPYAGVRDGVYRNLGGGRFEDVTAAWTASPPDGKGLGVAMADHDYDGDLDVFVANDQTPNNLWQNDGSGHLEDIGGLAGVNVSRDGESEAGMGVAFADYDDDGLEDVVVTNYQDQVNSLYRNEGDGFFMETSWEAGVGYPTRPLLGWGVGLVDLDNDGRKDLFFGCGHVDDTAARLSDYGRWAQADLVLRNVGGRFERVDVEGLDVERVTRGVAFGDVDSDGDVDVVCFDMDSRPRLLMNDSGAGAWLLVEVLGAAGTPAIGARVVVSAGERRMTATVQAGSSYLCHGDTRLHFGLGAASRAAAVEIHRLGGGVARYGPVAAGRLMVVGSDGEAWACDARTRARIERVETR